MSIIRKLFGGLLMLSVLPAEDKISAEVIALRYPNGFNVSLGGRSLIVIALRPGGKGKQRGR